MEEFKIELFRNEHGQEFIDFTHLSDESAQNLYQNIRGKFNILEPLDIYKGFESIKTYSPKWDASDSFNLRTYLESIGVEPMELIYINWYRFDDIDKLKFQDLVDYFDDLWYPGSDDIEIFDASLNWMVFVRHDGVLAYSKVKVETLTK